MKSLMTLVGSLLLLSSAFAGDWPTWGGNHSRNMVNDTIKNLPIKWDLKSGENIKWKQPLGSQSYGNPVVYKGKVFVGTNNEGLRDPKVTGDKGNVMAFDEKTGKFLWQAIHDKLKAGRVNDWPLQGVCSTPYVEGNRLWYLSNRCEIVCLDTEGFLDGKNDGVTDEQYKEKDHADIIWRYDMMEELGVFPHNLATSSPLVDENNVYVVTGNGVDEGHLNLPSPRSPSFIAVNKKTGELVWEYTADEVILHGQWSSPAAATINGKKMIIFPGGDGWVYALTPDKGELVWKFDCNPKDSKWELGGYGTRNNLISTPVVYDNAVFIGVGQDPEHGTGIGHFYRIDATKTGDITKSGNVWHLGNKDFSRTMSTAAIKDGLIYISDLDGIFYCVDAKTGKVYWKHDLFAAVWGSGIIADGRIYIGDEDGDIAVLALGKEKKLLAEMNMGTSVYTTPTPANGVLYLASRNYLYAIGK